MNPKSSHRARHLATAAAALTLLSAASLAQTTSPSATPRPAPQTLTPRPGTAAAPIGNPNDPPPPAHPATPAQIREYLTLTNATDNAHRALDQILQTSHQRAASFIPATFWDELKHNLDSIDVVTAFTPAYQRYFSEEDMTAAIAFYKTPVGHRIIVDQPLAAQAAGDVLRRESNRVGQETFDKHKSEIEAAQRAAQPAPTLSSPGQTTAPSNTPAGTPPPTLNSTPNTPK